VPRHSTQDSARTIQKDHPTERHCILYRPVRCLRRGTVLMYQGPITYQGNKRRLMPQIAPLLKPTRVFVDLFCGSGTVGLNAPAEKVLFNDVNEPVVDLLRFLARTPFTELYEDMQEVTEKYNLPWRAEGRMPEGTIQSHIKPGFLRMRDDYNEIGRAHV